MAALVLSRPSVLVRADHRIAVHHGRRFHPGAMLALDRQIARQIRRARLHNPDSVPRQFRFVFSLVLHGLAAHPQVGPVVQVHSALQMAAVPRGLRHGQDLAGIQIVERKDRFKAPGARVFFEILLQKQRRRSWHARDVVGIHKPLGP
jgi:hypothetical protein